MTQTTTAARRLHHPKIVAAQGGVYGPYTGTWFESTDQTNIEHTVARSEAHDSGLCASPPGRAARQGHRPVRHPFAIGAQEELDLNRHDIQIIIIPEPTDD